MFKILSKSRLLNPTEQSTVDVAKLLLVSLDTSFKSARLSHIMLIIQDLKLLDLHFICLIMYILFRLFRIYHTVTNTKVSERLKYNLKK